MIQHQANSGLLASCLKDVLSFVKPVKEDQMKRQRTIDELGILLQSIESFRNATIKPFGSYVSNLHTKWGDLDIAIQISDNPRIMVGQDKKRKLLRQLLNALRRTGIGYKFQYIPLARVPLLIYESQQHKISCDISIDNHFVEIKSKFLLWISQLDERFRDLVLLVKLWAKAHNINNPKSGTLNSYSLCLMIIFHLQTCQPAILPPLRQIYGGNMSHDVRDMGFVAESYVKQSFDAIMASFGMANKASLPELLISFFEKFSEIRSKSLQYAICTFTGQWESIYVKEEWVGKSYKLIIEDPFDRPENAARSVGACELITIADVFSETFWRLSSSRALSNRRWLLDCLIGPDIRRQLDVWETTQRPSCTNMEITQGSRALGTSSENIHRTIGYMKVNSDQDIRTAGNNSANVHRTMDHRVDSNNIAQHSQRVGRAPGTSSTDIHRTLDRFEYVEHQFESSNGTQQGQHRQRIIRTPTTSSTDMHKTLTDMHKTLDRFESALELKGEWRPSASTTGGRQGSIVWPMSSISRPDSGANSFRY